MDCLVDKSFASVRALIRTHVYEVILKSAEQEIMLTAQLNSKK